MTSWTEIERCVRAGDAYRNLVSAVAATPHTLTPGSLFPLCDAPSSA
jgi:hypothetical protein